MLWSLISLWILIKLVQAVYHLIKSFWAWLGRGPNVRRAVEQNLVSDEVREAVETIETSRAARKLGKGEQGPIQRLTPSQIREIHEAETIVREDFLDHVKISWYQITLIFFIGSVLGLVLEEVWMLITAGLTESRVGLVWGPFSPMYGAGAVLLTFVTFDMRRVHMPSWAVFLACMVVGGLLEQITGWAMETFMGAVSWDYIAGGVPGAITKWVAVPFLFFWGLLGYIWYRFVMPGLLYSLGVPTTRRKAIFVTALATYLGLDIFMTLVCFTRRAERDAGIPADNGFEEWVDENYSNAFMSERFQNMVIEGTGSAAAAQS